MVEAAATTCRMCAAADPPVETLMHDGPAPGAAPFCPQCDRRGCGNCKQRLLLGTERSCPGCGLVLKPLGQP